ncbi:MAG: hypothetical protein ACTSUO_09215 [Candidatus Thorarchaeota archaeon]
MTDIEPIDKIFPRILERISDSPRGWRVLNTPKGEMLFLGPKNAFQLKTISLSPYEFTGAGVEIENPGKALKSLRSSPEFGLRPLHEPDISSLVESMDNPLKTNSLLQSIISRAPMSPADVGKTGAEHLISGPVLRRPDLQLLDPTITKLQRTLDNSAQRIFRERYPMRAGMFY